MIELIRKLKQLNIKVFVDEGDLKINCADKSVLTDEIMQELRAGKEDLIRFFSNAVQQTTTNYQPIPVLPQQPYYDLSNSQQRLWTACQLNNVSVAYNMNGAFELTGILRPDIWCSAFDDLIARHESLRTVFHTVDGEVKQKILAPAETGFILQFKDAAGIPDFQPENEVRAFDNIVFNLTEGPLLRATILKVSEEKHLLLFGMHHIIGDGWSMGILIRDLIQYYNMRSNAGTAAPDPLRIQYKDYAAWQRQQLHLPETEKQRQYWKNVFQHEIPVLELPTDFIRPKYREFKGNTKVFFVDKATADLTKLCLDNGGTLFMGAMAAVNILLHKYSGQSDIIVGSPVSGRNHPDIENQIGFYVNTVCLRNTIEPQDTFKSYFLRLKENTLNVYKNQDYPLDLLVEDLQLKRDNARSVLFDVMIVLQGEDLNLQLQLPDMQVKPYPVMPEFSKFDLTFSFLLERNRLRMEIEYNTSIFSEQRISRMGKHLQTLIHQICATPDMPVSSISVLTEEEKAQLSRGFNDKTCAWPADKTLVQLFEEQVVRTPLNTAVTCDGIGISYQELNERSNRLAAYLRGTRGVQREDLIAVVLDRSINMAVTLMAILKAGAAYVPVDPASPLERITYILEDSQAKVLICNKNSYELTPNGTAIVELSANLYQQEPGLNLPVINSPGDLAYVIYTSGTTGNPKGVLIEHKNVVSLLKSDNQLFDFNEKDVWTMFHSYSFDFSVWEMYGALLHGGNLVVVPLATARNPEAFSRLIRAEKVTVLNQTPGAFRELLLAEATAAGSPNVALRYVIFGGEALEPGMLADVHQYYPACRLVNMYGITETTVHVTFKHITATEINSNQSNIGLPIPTLTAYLLDENKQLVPQGIPGELYVGGAGVARGYHNRPDLTAERFLDSPFRTHERLYKSGDMAVMIDSGEMKYLGRKDGQVKIRGHRVETGEIEFELSRHPSVTNVVVIALDDTDGNKFLAAYIVKTDSNVTAATLRTFLQRKLPEYMIPAAFVEMEQLPLTVNGKIDRKALPHPSGNALANTQEYVAPRTPEETMLVAIWEQLLEFRPIGIHDNFFEIGGHSLRATKVIAAIYKELDIKLELQQVFIHPTVAELAMEIEGLLWVKQAASGNNDSIPDAVTI